MLAIFFYGLPVGRLVVFAFKGKLLQILLSIFLHSTYILSIRFLSYHDSSLFFRLKYFYYSLLLCNFVPFLWVHKSVRVCTYIEDINANPNKFTSWCLHLVVLSYQFGSSIRKHRIVYWLTINSITYMLLRHHWCNFALIYCLSYCFFLICGP